MSKINILIVEDDQELLQALVDTLSLDDNIVHGMNTLSSAVTCLKNNDIDLIVSDVNFNQEDKKCALQSGMDFLKYTRENSLQIPFILMTAYATVDKAVEAVKLGAIDYLVKPFEAEQLINIVQKNVQVRKDDSIFVAVDDESVRVKRLAAQVASTDVSILINGESGTGKEVLASYIHHCSPRTNEPFIAINCAAIPENMLEAMLFGYEKGAYTGAHTSNPGKFEQAQGGTLLLDEISEMDISLQAKLLRVLQEKQVERLGGKNVIDLDVRILATTNRNIKQEVEKGRFREDLYYRLSVFPISLKSLRERKDDILPIIESLLYKYRNISGNVSLSNAAKDKLISYQWPGNVRELDNVIQRSIVLCNGQTILPEHVFIEDDGEDNNIIIQPENNLKENERSLILHALKEGNGSRKHAAEQLGISPRTLRYKLARLKDEGVEVPSAFGMA
ncbi:MAG: sigma-54 dependent transcriptional regulator [Gammaproteobacteria bacterium]|nr:sigma-54 dependent transcriptional regulator [Gammaproteobacteria bacterium]